MTWTAYIDGGSRGNPGTAGAGVYLLDEHNRAVLAVGFYLGRMTNNAAEYQGLLNSLRLLEAAGASHVRIFSDSELLVRQINGEYRVKSPGLKPLFAQARAGLERFREWRIAHVYRERNAMADALANRAMDMGKDVIETDTLGLLKTAEHAPKMKSGGRPAAQPASSPPATIEVRVVRAPAKGGCPAAMTLGHVFLFSEFTPAGFCMRAIPPVWKGVVSLQAAPAGQDKPIIVNCEHPGCRAAFELRRRPRT